MQNVVTETTIFLINLIRAECGEGGGYLESVLTVFYLIPLEKYLHKRLSCLRGFYLILNGFYTVFYSTMKLCYFYIYDNNYF